LGYDSSGADELRPYCRPAIGDAIGIGDGPGYNCGLGARGSRRATRQKKHRYGHPSFHKSSAHLAATVQFVPSQYATTESDPLPVIVAPHVFVVESVTAAVRP
jgi:hypothetical protein